MTPEAALYRALEDERRKMRYWSLVEPTLDRFWATPVTHEQQSAVAAGCAVALETYEERMRKVNNNV